MGIYKQSIFKLKGDLLMKKILLLTLLVFSFVTYGATTGQTTTSANVGQLINIGVARANSLGDIRVANFNNVHIITLTIDNNDDDGYTLNFQSDNGTRFATGDNFGYLIHDSAADTPTANPNNGQKPTTRYELMLCEASAATTYGHVTNPANVADSCASPEDSVSKFEITSNSGTNVIFNSVNKATLSAIFNLLLSQTSDVQLFHGDFSDTIVVSISDN